MLERSILHVHEGLLQGAELLWVVQDAFTGEILRVVRGRNQITDSWRNHVRSALKGDVTDVKIKYLAFGDGTTAPAAGQTQLVNELFRKAVTLQTAGATGVLTTVVHVAPGESNFHIKEAAWFAGPAATAAANSGVMVSRVLFDEDKTNLKAIQSTRTDTLAAA